MAGRFREGLRWVTRFLVCCGAVGLFWLLAGAAWAAQLPGANTTVLVDPAAVSTVAGSGADATADGSGAAASFRQLGGVVVADGSGYVATAGSVRRVVLASGSVSTLAGHATATGLVDSANPAAVRFGYLSAIASDGVSLFVGDGTVVRKVSLATGATSSLANVGGNKTIQGLTVGPSGTVYAEAGTAIFAVNPASGAVSTFVSDASCGLGAAGYWYGLAADSDGLYWLACSTLRKARFSDGVQSTVATTSLLSTGYSWGGAVASAGDYLYVTGGTGSHTVLRVTKSSGAWSAVAGTGSAGFANGTGAEAWLNNVVGLWSDGVGVAVADSGNRRLRLAVPGTSLPAGQSPHVSQTVSVSPGAVTTFAGSGVDATVDGTGAQAAFRQMGGVAAVGGSVFVATAGSVRRVDPASGAVTVFEGDATQTGLIDSAGSQAARFGWITAMVADGSFLYVADQNRVRRVSLATGATSTVAGVGSNQAQVRGLTVGPDGMLYATTGTSIVQVDPQRGVTSTWVTGSAGCGSGSLSQWVGPAADGDALYVMACTSVLKIRFADRQITTLASVSALSTQPAPAGPSGAIASAGDFLYLTGDTGSLRLLRVSKANGAWTGVGGTGTGGWHDGTGTDAWFSSIQGVWSDGAGVWVADSGNRRLRRVVAAAALPGSQPASVARAVSEEPAVVSTVAGQDASGTVDGVGSSAAFDSMGGLAVADGAVYVSSNATIRRVDPVSGAVTTFLGVPGQSAIVNSVDPAAVRLASGVLATDGYYLYTCDSYYVRRISLTTRATSTVAGAYCSNGLAVGPDSMLYSSDGMTVTRIDPVSGATSMFANIPDRTSFSSSNAFGLAADTSGLYFRQQTQLRKIDFQTAAVSTVANSGNGLIGNISGSQSRSSSVVSAGPYVYLAAGNYSQYVVRVEKSSGLVALTAGRPDAVGSVDGSGSDATFGQMIVLASDGSALWAADYGTRRVRAITDEALAPGGGQFGYDAYAAAFDDVSTSIGSYGRIDTDVDVSAVGPDLELVRSYNSSDRRSGAFGLGWTGTWEQSVSVLDADHAVVLYGDGRRELHTRDAGGVWRPPAGVFTTLAPTVGGGWSLTERDGTVASFDQLGRVIGVADPAGHVVNVSYTGGQATEVRDVTSGRRLQFSWSGDRVVQVSTDYVASASGPLVWRYYYAGNRLERACDPRDNSIGGRCLVYTYTSAGRIASVIKPAANTDVAVTYDPAGRVATRTDGAGATTTFARPDASHVTVTDPSAHSTAQALDSNGRLTAETDAMGATTSFAYNTAGVRTTVTDGGGNTTATVPDGAGNIVSATDADGHTAYASYDGVGNRTAVRDPRSAGPVDNTYATTWTYNTARQVTSEHTPPTAQQPAGTARTWAYTTGIEAAVGGGTMPSGLLRTETNALGGLTTYAYDSHGDLRQQVDPAGKTTSWTYDELGRRTSETETTPASPAALTTTYAINAFGDVTETVKPAAQNPVTGLTHQQRTRTTYDANRNPIQTVEDDVVGGDPPRTTTRTFDAVDRLVTVTDPEGGMTWRTYDSVGNLAQTIDAAGRHVEISYDAANRPTAKVTKAVADPNHPEATHDVVLAQAAYDPAGRKTSQTDALGRQRSFTYDHSGRPTSTQLDQFHNRDGTTRAVTLEAIQYDSAGNPTTVQTAGGTRSTFNTFDQAGRLVTSTLDPAGLARTTTRVYDAAGNVTTETRSDATRSEQTRKTYDTNSRLITTTVENGAVDLTTTTAYDSRGLQIAETNPAGATTTHDYDTLGRRIATHAPTVTIEEQGQTPTAAAPTTTFGYDTYGNQTQVADPRGAVTTTAYDRLGRRTSITHPAYTAPGATTALVPTESFSYDSVGNLTARTSRRGETTTYAFDSLNRVVRKTDPLVTGAPAAGEIRSRYDDAGNRVEQIDQSGAHTEWTYDDGDRPRSRTQVVRQGGSGCAADRCTTELDYDDAADNTWTRTPKGAVSSSTYNAAGEIVTATDPAGQVTTYGHDLGGRQTTATDPLGRKSEESYDLAGRRVAHSRRDGAGVVLDTSTYEYDAAGNRTAEISGEGRRRDLGYDPVNRLTAVVDHPATGTDITATAGYDATGNRTRITDGNGRTTWTRFQSWNLAEETVEPATVPYPNTADRSTVTSYDAGGLAVVVARPGGGRIERGYDALGRLSEEKGTGPGVVSAQRSFGYDLVGRTTSVGHPGGAVQLAYDDRALLVGQSGGAGTASFGYDADGRLTSRTDAAGTATFAWTSRGDLASMVDPLTQTSIGFDWDPARELTAVHYGTGPGVPVRAYGYDGAGRLASDMLTDATGAVSASAVYGYDRDDNVTSTATVIAGNAASGTTSYGYDGAGRLDGWAAAGQAPVDVGYDAAGNRTRVGDRTFSYDERNRLSADSDATAYTYSAAGALTSKTRGGVAESFGYDAFDRLVSSDAASYSYDSLDRIADRNAVAASYDGVGLDAVVTPEGAVVGRSPEGRAVSVEPAGGTGRLAGADRHGDVTHTFDPQSGAVVDSSIADPYGNGAATTGDTAALGAVGFQGDYTDSDTGLVWMGARWYDPATATFLTRDSVAGELATPASLNAYTYAWADPLNKWDPDGHWPSLAGAWRYISNAVASLHRTVTRFAGQVLSAPLRAVRTLASAAAWAGRTLTRVAARVTRTLATKTANVTSLFVRSLRAGFAEGVAMATDAYRGAANFYAGLGNKALRMTGIGPLMGWHIDPVYTDSRYAGSYRVGEYTADIEATLALAGAGTGSLNVSLTRDFFFANMARRAGTAALVGTTTAGIDAAIQYSTTGKINTTQTLTAGLQGATATYLATGAATAPRGGLGGGDDLTRVGRWMSPEEHVAMVDNGMVQPGRYSPQTDVAHPAHVEAFMRQAAPGSRYVEFDVPSSSVVPGGKEGWAHIPGPNSIFSRLAQRRGLPPYSYPPATNIEWVASRIRL